MSHFEYMGRDESAPGMLFYRLINPTEFDKAGVNLQNRIILDYGGFSWINLKSAFTGGTTIVNFLENYVKTSRQLKEGYTPAQAKKWINIFINKYGYTESDLNKYFAAFYDLVQESVIPQLIYRPFDYEPTEVWEDIGETVLPSKKTLSSAAIIVVLIGGGYLLVKGGVLAKGAKLIKKRA